MCAAADWTGAMACTDVACVVEAAGAECVDCVRATQACIDGRSSGCDAMCSECLGPARCATLDNVGLAATHLTPTADPAYQGGATTVYRIGALQMLRVHAVTPDGLRVLADETAKFGGPRTPGMALTDADGRALRAWVSDCWAPVVSPQATWLAERCGEEVRFRELRTGFLRHTVEVEPELRRFDIVFGGELVAAVETAHNTWSLVDLAEGTIGPLRGVSEHQNGNQLRLSPDGAYAANAGVTRVWPLGDAPPVQVPEWPFTEEFTWIDPQTVLVAARDSPVRLVSFPDWRVLKEVVAPTYDEETRTRWQLQLVGGEMVFLGSSESGPLVKWGADAAEAILPLGGYSLYQVLGNVRGGTPSPHRVAGDEAVFTTALGPLTWSPGRGLRNPEIPRGALLWEAAGAPHELLVGMSTGAVSVDLRTGETTDLALPADYRLIGVRRSQGALVALGSRPGDKECERRRSVLIRRGGVDEIVELDTEPLVAALDPDGRLHVIADAGLRTYENGKVVKSTRWQAGYASLTRGGPPRALRSQGVLSFDGTRSLIVEGTPRGFRGFAKKKPGPSRARLIRTSDHKVLKSFDASSCVFARRTSVFGCLEERGDRGEVELVTYDADGNVITGMDANITGSEMMEVSDDGGRVITGQPQFETTRALWDLTLLSLHDLPNVEPARHHFHSDGRLVAVGPTYVEIFDGVPAARE